MGALFPDQPAQHVIAGPARDGAGDLIYEVAPPVSTGYRLHYLSDFGQFAEIEVAPRLDLRVSPAGRKGEVVLLVRAFAERPLRAFEPPICA